MRSADFSFNKYLLTPENIANILLQTSINGILAMGMTLVILTGGIDLSVGSVLAFSSIVAATFVNGDNPQSPFVALLVGSVTGALLGLINGCIIAYLKIPPFVATLGMLSVAQGLTYTYTGGMPVPNLTESFLSLGEGSLLGVPVPVLIFVLIFAILWVVLNHTTYSHNIYAVGGNVKSARTAGMSTNPVTASVYVIAGLLAGLGGLILTARTSSALPRRTYLTN